MPVALEANCEKCSETFNPASTRVADLVHGQKADGAECGGLGQLTGEWY